MQRLANFPFFVILMAITSVSMLAPAIVGVQAEEFQTARAFFYTSALLAMFTAMLAITLQGYKPKNIGRSHLITLVGAYVGLPLLFAIPVTQAISDTTAFNAFFEMVSAFTTTGATLFEGGRLDAPLHLWRAEVAWLGGLFIWITAAAIFAPLNLGGYEISAGVGVGRGVGGTSALLPDLETSTRLIRITTTLFPVYFGLTGVLWVCMIIAGTPPLQGVIYAMSALSTSGITMMQAGQAIDGGGAVECLLLMFLLFAFSRRSFSTESILQSNAKLSDDPEIRVGFILIGVVVATLFFRHFVGAVEVGTEGETVEVFNALWGTVFTVVSFLSTAGFVSEHWTDAQGWSGLNTPGFALLGLAVIGGGVATTAGGVKLLRVYALYIHGRRELRRLVHPSMVTGEGRHGRKVAGRGVYLAWLFFMLFALSIAIVWVTLALQGVPFEAAMLLTVSALSTTGPLAPVVSNGDVIYEALSTASKTVLMGAMILGRLETLAMIALLNTDFWRS